MDRALRYRSKQLNQSLNRVAVEALTKGLNLAETPVRFQDLDYLAGTWEADAAFDAAMAAQDQVDPNVWK